MGLYGHILCTGGCKRCILVGYYFQGAVVAGFLKNFVYACMDMIRPGISVPPAQYTYELVSSSVKEAAILV